MTEPDEEWSIVSTGRELPKRIPVGIAVLAIGLAFVLGLLLPGIRKESPDVKSPVSVDVAPAASVHSNGRTITLIRLSQRGRSVRSEFRLDKAVDPLSIATMSVEVTTGNNGRKLALGPLAVEAGGDSLSMSFELDSPDLPVRILRVTGLTVRRDSGLTWDLSIEPIWPVRTKEPLILYVKDQRPFGGKTVSLVAVIAWRNLLEAVFDTSQVNVQGALRYSFNPVVLTYRIGSAERTLTAEDPQFRSSLTRLVASFEDVPEDARRMMLKLPTAVEFQEGSWSWKVEG